jgi:hypothetical protein
MPDAVLHGCVRKLNDMGFEALVAVSITVMFVGNAVSTCRSFRFVYFAWEVELSCNCQRRAV